MRSQLSFCILLLLTTCSGSVAQTPAVSSTVKDGFTLVAMEPLKISGAKDEYYSLHLGLSYKSNESKTPETVDFEIQTVVKKRKLNPDLYIVFLIEGDEVFLSSDRRAVKNPVPGRRWFGERIVMRMPIATYLKLTDAKSGVIRMGRTRFELSAEQKTAMKKLLQSGS